MAFGPWIELNTTLQDLIQSSCVVTTHGSKGGGGGGPLSAEELDDIFENAAAELQAQNESNMEPAKTSNGEIKITHEGMNI